MSKTGYISRYMLIMGVSIRTFQRDIREIRNMFGIDIAYGRSQKGYYISQAEMKNMNFRRMMEAFDMFNSLNLTRDLSPFVHLENRRANTSSRSRCITRKRYLQTTMTNCGSN